MRTSKLTKLCQLIGLSLVSLPMLANEQPDAESLVGHSYLGGHAMFIRTDNDRLFTQDANSSIDNGSGIGAEFGYRISPWYEARLSYTNLNIDTENKGYDVPDGSSVAFDLLYFPYQKSFYFVAGADFLDIDNSNLSADLGAGYRYFISNNAAFYLEGKGHYQLDDDYTDFSTKIGFIYYFGEHSSPVKQTKPAPANNTPAPVAKDTDKDGVFDNNDKCANTPMTDKVDAYGCTIFTEQQKTITLLVNFDNNKSDVKDSYLDEVKRVADFMKAYPHTSLTINGHTSAQGEASYNQQLSERRAQAIVTLLVEKFAIDQSRLKAVGYGEEQLLDTNNSAQAHAKNRRIEAKVTTVKKVAVKR